MGSSESGGGGGSARRAMKASRVVKIDIWIVGVYMGDGWCGGVGMIVHVIVSVDA
jgi:hypothetical protein